MNKEFRIKSKAIDAQFTAFTTSDNKSRIGIEIDMEQYIDPYTYHDAPSLIDIWIDKKELKQLIIELQQTLDNTTKLEEYKCK